MNTLPVPVVILAGLASSPEALARVYREVRRLHPAFPDGANVLTVWYLLWLAGMPAPYAASGERFVVTLQRFGYRALPPTEPPRAGDLFLAPEANHFRFGVVAKAAVSGDWFLATDETLSDHRPRRMQCSEVSHWLRFG